MSIHPITAEYIHGVLSCTQSLWPGFKAAGIVIMEATGSFGIQDLETVLAAVFLCTTRKTKTSGLLPCLVVAWES